MSAIFRTAYASVLELVGTEFADLRYALFT